MFPSRILDETHVFMFFIQLLTMFVVCELCDASVSTWVGFRPGHRVLSLKSSAFAPSSFCTCPKYDFNIFFAKNISIYVPSVLVLAWVWVWVCSICEQLPLSSLLRLRANINRRAYYTMLDACPAQMELLVHRRRKRVLGTAPPLSPPHPLFLLALFALQMAKTVWWDRGLSKHS